MYDFHANWTYGEWFQTPAGLQQIFSPFLAHLSQRLKWAIVIGLRPASVVGVVVVVNFSHFQLLLQNHWRDFDETW